MKTVFNNIDDVAKLFVEQKQHFGGTPIKEIRDRSKGRRFYFKGDTIYSYRDSYPLAKIVNDKVFIKTKVYSNTTSKHRNAVLRVCNNKKVIASEDLCTPNSNDEVIEKRLKKVINAKLNAFSHRTCLITNLKNNFQPITKSKFPLLFDEKHKKLKSMFFSNDVEIFNLSKKLIKQQNLI